jgi:type II secretory pathway component PulM
MAAQSRVANLELELANLEQRNEQVQLHLHREIADLRELAGASDVKQKMAALEAEKAQLQGVLASQMADKQTRLKMSDDFLQSAHQSLEETRAQLRRSQASLEIEKMSGAALAAQLAALRERYFVHVNENTAECP